MKLTDKTAYRMAKKCTNKMIEAKEYEKYLDGWLRDEIKKVELDEFNEFLKIMDADYRDNKSYQFCGEKKIVWFWHTFWAGLNISLGTFNAKMRKMTDEVERAS